LTWFDLALITIFKSCYGYEYKTICSKGEEMSEETWHGIPRNKIPWYPIIDYQKCINCGKCEDYCKLGVYELEEREGKNKSVVKNPNSCVVLCTGCDGICPVGAIKHQSKKETHEIIKALRNTYSVKSEKRAKIGANHH
jgi:NAD-dependent dihydropyrimidine dehydrogenase PreA subunit